MTIVETAEHFRLGTNPSCSQEERLASARYNKTKKNYIGSFLSIYFRSSFQPETKKHEKEQREEKNKNNPKRK